MAEDLVKLARQAFKACRPVDRVACQDFGMQQDDILDQQLAAALAATHAYYAATIEQQAASLAEKDKEIGKLMERLGPHGLEVVMINARGHYVSTAVKNHIDLLQEFIDDMEKLKNIYRDDCQLAESRAEQAERALKTSEAQLDEMTRSCLAEREGRLKAESALAEAVEVIKRDVTALDEADAQIEYLHDKFKPTGSGSNALAKIDIATTAARAFVAQHGSDSREGK